jgi:hypothetical protein
MSVISKMMVSMQVALGDAKTAGVVATGTMGFSVAQLMGWLQANVGFIGAVMGIILTAVTIRVQWANGRKAELELEILRRQLDK